MNLLDSLLDAIARLEGDALVMHVGEKPYVVTAVVPPNTYRGPLAWGQVELSSRVLTSEAVLGMLAQILPIEQRDALQEFGATEYEIPGHEAGANRFTIVAARGGDDIWLEVRRRPKVQAEAPPAISETPAPAVEPAPAAIIRLDDAPAHKVVPDEHPIVVMEHDTRESSVPAGQTDEEEDGAIEISLDAIAAPAPVIAAAAPKPPAIEVVPEESQSAPTDEEVDALLASTAAVLRAKGKLDDPPQVSAREPVAPAPEPVAAVPEPVASVPEPVLVPEPVAIARPPEVVVAEPAVVAHQPAIAVQPIAVAAAPPRRVEMTPVVSVPEAVRIRTEESRHAVVLPLSRTSVRHEPSSEIRAGVGASLERILRIGAARGAATVYVVAQSPPMIRVDGEISLLDGEPVMTTAEVERLVMDLSPAHGREAAHPVEWIADVTEAGRVRCLTFRDHRGPGIIVRMIPPKAISADQLGLSAEVQALCAQPDGLVLVSGARASGKSTLLSAFVDQINRTRSDHVITVESQIGFVHESRRSFVSQREVRGDGEAATAAVRSALREDPDVLVIEDLRTPEIVAVALEAAESGRLVFGSIPATSTVAAVERLVEMFPADRRAHAQSSLAVALRGVVAQVLLRKVKGGRVAAREVLLNTPSVAGLILEGKMFQLPVALDSGRRHGMMPLADSLAALVRDGLVHASEAYRKAPDRDALLALMRRDGVDTSFAERLA